MSSKNNEKKEESFLDQTLRPTRWEDYIGQKHIKDNVKILLKAAEERGHIPEHILFYVLYQRLFYELFSLHHEL